MFYVLYVIKFAAFMLFAGMALVGLRPDPSEKLDMAVADGMAILGITVCIAILGGFQ